MLPFPTIVFSVNLESSSETLVDTPPPHFSVLFLEKLSYPGIFTLELSFRNVSPRSITLLLTQAEIEAALDEYPLTLEYKIDHVLHTLLLFTLLLDTLFFRLHLPFHLFFCFVFDFFKTSPSPTSLVAGRVMLCFVELLGSLGIGQTKDFGSSMPVVLLAVAVFLSTVDLSLAVVVGGVGVEIGSAVLLLSAVPTAARDHLSVRFHWEHSEQKSLQLVQGPDSYELEAIFQRPCLKGLEE